MASSMGSIVPLLLPYKASFGIESAKMFDMPLNKDSPVPTVKSSIES